MGLCGGWLGGVVVVVGFVGCLLRGLAVVFLAAEMVSSGVSWVDVGRRVWGVLVCHLKRLLGTRTGDFVVEMGRGEGWRMSM